MESLIKHVVTGFDFSTASRRALEAAAAVAALSDAEMTVTTAVPNLIDAAEVRRIMRLAEYPIPRIEAAAIGLEEVEDDVKRVVGLCDTKGVPISYDVGEKTPARMLLETADIYDTDAIFIGAVGREGDFVRGVGVDTMRLVRASMWPVFVIKRDKPFPPAQILACVDLSDASKRALGWGIQLAEAFDAHLEILSVAVAHDLKARVEGETRVLLESLELPDSLSVRQTVRVGTPYRVITQMADEGEFDLVTLGTLGRNVAIELLIGGTSERVLRNLPTSVLLAKPDSFVLRKFKNPV